MMREPKPQMSARVTNTNTGILFPSSRVHSDPFTTPWWPICAFVFRDCPGRPPRPHRVSSSSPAPDSAWPWTRQIPARPFSDRPMGPAAHSTTPPGPAGPWPRPGTGWRSVVVTSPLRPRSVSRSSSWRRFGDLFPVHRRCGSWWVARTRAWDCSWVCGWLPAGRAAGRRSARTPRQSLAPRVILQTQIYHHNNVRFFSSDKMATAWTNFNSNTNKKQTILLGRFQIIWVLQIDVPNSDIPRLGRLWVRPCRISAPTAAWHPPGSGRCAAVGAPAERRQSRHRSATRPRDVGDRWLPSKAVVRIPVRAAAGTAQAGSPRDQMAAVRGLKFHF